MTLFEDFKIWWDMPKDGVSAHVPGFTDRTADEGARAFFIAGQKGDARGVALKQASFTLPYGEATAIIGRSGSGIQEERWRACHYNRLGEVDVDVNIRASLVNTVGLWAGHT